MTSTSPLKASVKSAGVLYQITVLDHSSLTDLTLINLSDYVNRISVAALLRIRPVFSFKPRVKHALVRLAISSPSPLKNGYRSLAKTDFGFSR